MITLVHQRQPFTALKDHKKRNENGTFVDILGKRGLGGKEKGK